MKSTKDKDLDFLFNQIVADTLKKKREQQGLTLQQMATKVHTTRQNIFKYENNMSRIKNDLFIKICLALGEEPKNVFREIQEEFNKTNIK